ncbi:histidine phosphatase family protein [Nocardioides acrostichi]|uniref:Histidine phosphatase family protein n=1 Tax=Nocardioides acrostichi TaxID=2784339 RepID=A0A930UW51_9ACTN|nr:histidine phosphatase family protein [Nocardioides acrostichi]MBF4161968.1 histidine phosphatase family protein [Nocardioides acrostichi]
MTAQTSNLAAPVLAGRAGGWATRRRLVLLRHGRTTYNAEKRIQGQVDSSLDDVGLAQAAAVAPVIASLGPVLLWSSDLGRAAATAAHVSTATGLEVRTDERLREFSLGRYEGHTHDDLARVAPDQLEHLRRGDFHLLTEAEPVDAVRARFNAALGELWAALEPGQLGIAVSHGAAIRTALAEQLRWPHEVARQLNPLENCGWVELVEGPQEEPPRLIAYNRTAPAGG